jgi:hypothetical protein
VQSESAQFFPYAFPVYFVGLWLVVTTMLGFLSGWNRLQSRYPSDGGAPILTLRSRSGSMGMGVNMSGILTLSACPSGLRVGIWKIFGPFQRPFLVPWKDIDAAPSRSLFAPMIQLRFGMPEIGRLKIDARSWELLRAAAAQENTRDLPPAPEHVTAGATARAMLLQWAVITIGAGCFFYFVPRLQGWQEGLPPVLCFAFPAVVFGLATLVRFARQAR